MSVAKQVFNCNNENTYRGYFPIQPGDDNLKEGFELGSAGRATPEPRQHDRGIDDDDKADNKPKGEINLSEPNVWPLSYPHRAELEKLYTELQSLSQTLLSLLATALGKPSDTFAAWKKDSLSTLRLLHYPSPSTHPPNKIQELCCTPHTDSGILTLLTQDETGGLEVLCATGKGDNKEEWIPAPYVPNSIVVNIGDLMAKVSGGRFKATMHRVRRSPGRERWSVPFFFEPGEDCFVGGEVGEAAGDESIEKGERTGDGLKRAGVRYGDHVRQKMRGWVEFKGMDMEEGDGKVLGMERIEKGRDDAEGA